MCLSILGHVFVLFAMWNACLFYGVYLFGVKFERHFEGQLRVSSWSQALIRHRI